MRWYAIFALCFLSSPVFATSNWTNARVVVSNFSSDKFTLHCQVGRDTAFSDFGDQKTHDFFLKDHDHAAMMINPILTLGSIEASTCYHQLCCQKDGGNWFVYDVIEPYDEKVLTAGRFQYDEAYPGALTYQ